MKRIFRWLWNGLTVLALLVCMATAVLWVRSYWYRDTFRLIGWSTLLRRDDTAVIDTPPWIIHVPEGIDHRRLHRLRIITGGGAILIGKYSEQMDGPTPERIACSSGTDLDGMRRLFSRIDGSPSAIMPYLSIAGIRVLAVDEKGRRGHVFYLACSLWLLVSLTALLPARRLISWWQRNRK